MILSFGSSSPWLTTASALALAGYVVAAFLRPGRPQNTVWGLAWAAHLVAILTDVIGWQAVPPGARFGFAPALSVTIWLVLAVYALESRAVAVQGPQRALALLGAVAVALAWVFPGEMHPRAGSAWAPVHWILGIASYGLFGVAVLHGAMLLSAEKALRSRIVAGASTASGQQGLPLLRLERMTFGFVVAGFVMLTLAILLGAAFAAPWRWDHKTVFSLLGWLVFAGLLIGRQTLGWRGRRAVRWLYAGAGLLLMAYVGSRFVFEVLLQRPAGG